MDNTACLFPWRVDLGYTPSKSYTFMLIRRTRLTCVGQQAWPTRMVPRRRSHTTTRSARQSDTSTAASVASNRATRGSLASTDIHTTRADYAPTSIHATSPSARPMPYTHDQTHDQADRRPHGSDNQRIPASSSLANSLEVGQAARHGGLQDRERAKKKSGLDSKPATSG